MTFLLILAAGVAVLFSIPPRLFGRLIGRLYRQRKRNSTT